MRGDRGLGDARHPPPQTYPHSITPTPLTPLLPNNRSPPKTFRFLTFNFQRAPVLSRPARAWGHRVGLLQNRREKAKEMTKKAEKSEGFGGGGGGGTRHQREEGGGKKRRRRRRRVGRADLNHAIYSESYQKSASPIWFSSGCRMRQGGCLPCADLFNFTLQIIH